jgi:hypothetical protein
MLRFSRLNRELVGGPTAAQVQFFCLAAIAESPGKKAFASQAKPL